MYLKELKGKDLYDTLKNGSCMSCGLIPKYTSALNGNGVTTTISYKDNPGWTYLINEDKTKITHCYCPLCTRKIKLLKLKEKI